MHVFAHTHSTYSTQSACIIDHMLTEKAQKKIIQITARRFQQEARMEMCKKLQQTRTDVKTGNFLNTLIEKVTRSLSILTLFKIFFLVLL